MFASTIEIVLCNLISILSALNKSQDNFLISLENSLFSFFCVNIHVEITFILGFLQRLAGDKALEVANNQLQIFKLKLTGFCYKADKNLRLNWWERAKMASIESQFIFFAISRNVLPFALCLKRLRVIRMKKM